MNIAIISGGKVTDACLFDDLATAQDFLGMGVWPGAEMVLELPEGYGIGDSYDAASGAWTKAPAPEPPVDPPMPPEPTTALEERVAALENGMDEIRGAMVDANTALDIVEGVV